MDLVGEFEAIVHRMESLSHGSDSWKELAQFFQHRFKRSQSRLAFLGARFVRSPIHWEDVREVLWPGDLRRQEENQFPFLQGDVIRTSLVEPWISRQGDELRIFGVTGAAHAQWLVLSPDCDAVRSDFVRLAPLYDAMKINERMALALAFKSAHIFPVPRLVCDPPGFAGRHADLSQLYLLDCRRGRGLLVKRLSSLTEAGWHVLNAQLIHQVSRAEERQQAIALRNS